MANAFALVAAEDGAAQGEAEAAARTRAQLLSFDADAAADGSAMCKSVESRRAVILFVLSGAGPQAARTCLADKALAGSERRLFEGAAAYAAGRTEAARLDLAATDPFSLSPVIGDQLALIRAGVSAGKDRALAIHLLDVARLLGTGGLVEEAALRQEIFLLGEAGDIEKFTFLSRQYMERFHRSLYAGNFFEGFVLGVMRLGLAADDSRFLHLRRVIERLDPGTAVSVYLLLARRALLASDFAAARRAAAAAIAEKSIGADDRRRAALYAAAAGIFGSNWQQATGTLDALPGRGLEPRDILLRDAAITLAARVREAPHPGTGTHRFEPSAAMKAASSVLAAADKALGVP